jgi:hypothetical protein
MTPNGKGRSMDSEKSTAPTLAELQALMAQGRHPIPDLKTLKVVIADAFALYDAMEARGRLSDLLARIEEHTDAEVFTLIVFDLARFIQPRLRKALAEILEVETGNSSTLVDLSAGMLQRRLVAIQTLKQRARNLCSEAGIADTASSQRIENEICRQLQSDGATLNRIEASDFSDVDRLFHGLTQAPKGSVQ